MRTQLRLTPENLPEYLRNRGLAGPREALLVEPAGDGNINWVRRVRPAQGGPSRIVKQARPALERFPEYEVTTERIVFEARYYEVVRPFDAGAVCPAVLHFDAEERVLVLEDLGEVPRLDGALARSGDPALAARTGRTLGSFLGAVHAGTAGDGGLLARFENDAMRKLHGDHIFDLPFRPNDFKLSPALRGRAESLWRDERAVAIADAAYRDYLSPEGALVHGDVQGGNVLLDARSPRLLDAEIAHVGDPAFDVGILLAHLVVAAAARGEAARALPALRETWLAYVEARGRTRAPDYARAARYAGIELVRRTLGAARLDVVDRDDAALRVLDLGLRWLTAPPDAPATA